MRTKLWNVTKMVGVNDNELLVPLETLREFAQAYNSHQRQGSRLRYSLAQLARIAFIEGGLQDTPWELPGGSGFEAIHLVAEYLHEKDELTPEEHTEVAIALREMGRFAYHFPQAVGLRYENKGYERQ